MKKIVTAWVPRVALQLKIGLLEYLNFPETGSSS